MSEEEAHALKLRVEAAEAANPEELGPTNRNNTHLAYTCIDEVAHHPVIVGAVSDLIGEDIVLYGTVLFFKEPKSAGFVSWHQDATYFGLRPYEHVSAWIALSPATLESGCMRFVPGSHQAGQLDHRAHTSAKILNTCGQELADAFDRDRAVANLV